MSLKFPQKIAIGIRCKKRICDYRRLVKNQKLITVTELAKKYEDMGISNIIFTDIDKDGVLESEF